MRASSFPLVFAAFAAALPIAIPGAAIPAAMAQTAGGAAQVSPLRPDFTRPGGLPGAPRAGVGPSGGLYMIAPAQPKTLAAPQTPKTKRKRR